MCPIDGIRVSARPMVAFSGFYESHGPPPSGDMNGIVSAYHNGHQNGQTSGHILHCHSFAVTLAAAGAIRSKYSPDGNV